MSKLISLSIVFVGVLIGVLVVKMLVYQFPWAAETF